jgi:hypothetical protein
MDGTEPAAPSGQPEAVVPLSLAVVMGKAADASRICRVDAPDRVLRVWAMLSSVSGELRQASLRPEARARLQLQLGAFTAELERSLSPALAGELHRIIDRDKDTELTADELRVEYATLLAWTIGLVIGMLSQIDAASTKIGRPGSRPQLVTSE